MIVKDGKILSISRRKNRAKFGLIGGKIDANETPFEAIIRETKEETGINVLDAICFYRAIDDDGFNTNCFYAIEHNGFPESKEEGEVVWLTKEELLGEKGAFPIYNQNAFDIFRNTFPLIRI